MSDQGPPSGWQPPQAGWQPPADQPPVPPPPYGYGSGQPAYGQPPPGASPQTETTAIVALVLAIASFVICPVLPAIVGLVLASSATRKINQSGGRLTGDGLVKAAKIIAWVNLGLWAVLTVVFIIAAALGAGDDNELDYGLRVLSTL